jgi:hypothetical protein
MADNSGGDGGNAFLGVLVGGLLIAVVILGVVVVGGGGHFWPFAGASHTATLDVNVKH